MAKKEEITLLPSGVTTRLLGRDAYDWPSIRVLAEKGVPYKTIARHFNGLDTAKIAKTAHSEGWLTPAREKKMRKDLATRQAETLKRTGKVRDPEEVMAEIWKERQAHLDERTFEIVEQALAGVDPETARLLIQEAKDLKTIHEVGRRSTGQDKRDQQDLNSGPQIAIDLGFLRSADLPDSPTTIDV